MMGGFSTHALHAKAAALLDGASKLSSSWSPRKCPSPYFLFFQPTRIPRAGHNSSNNFTETLSIFEHTITRFTNTLLPLHQLQATIPDDKYSWYTIHSLAHTAIIHLHQPFIQDDQHSRDMSIRAARAVTVVTKHIADADYDYLDPVIGVSHFRRRRQLSLTLMGFFSIIHSIAGYLLREYSSSRSPRCRYSYRTSHRACGPSPSTPPRSAESSPPCSSR